MFRLTDILCSSKNVASHKSKVDVNNKKTNKFFTTFNLNSGSTSTSLDLLVVEQITDDIVDNIPNGWIDNIYYIKDQEQKRIGYITYRPSFGQICSIEVDPDYRNSGVGKQMIINVVKELNKIGVKEVWAISTNDNFWKNVFDKSFSYNNKRKCYCMDINKFINKFTNK